ncbi:hypothetical protein GCM10007103_20680 [Salinimicrobium marinum]|uniref:Uncharacterized protein n=1 Tax=Salinimicrobium marinum TaxID=680283 RepID=A0A918SHS1_9FLAO|nr:hypothetical protein [Salinimicrobium marinum]GHA39120.1 hypothetical protein GCM10007103_20680 [Salinimicrobium marinum]
MLQHLLRFSLLLFLVTGIAYGLHLYINQLFFDVSVELINFAYKFNVGFTFIFTTSIILASEKLKDQLGFIYLLGGAVKLGIFAYLIQTSDVSISKSVFLHFFVPYVVCVILELFYVIKLLNAANFRQDK